jgi:flagellar basal-body rod protein FlgC
MNDLFRAFNISASGMYAQRVRMNVVASNLANYESYRVNGEPFRKLEVVFQALEDPKNLSKGEVPVRVVEIRQSNEPFRLVYDPYKPKGKPGRLCAKTQRGTCKGNGRHDNRG